ncbi:hypothetical protein N7454_010409 [Penicillium verhagenii]|nr:hypothetical protein N7454_010409 [Penicillium verhagenii]
MSSSAAQPFPLRAEDLNLPPEPGVPWNLALLGPPPPDWAFLNIRYDNCHNNRNIRFNISKVLAAFHFWGITWTDQPSPTKQTILKGLWKLFYHMPERNRPKEMADLWKFSRDTGPRLMGWEHHNPIVGPVSRYYPDPPDPYSQVEDPLWIRNPDASDDLPDSIVEQYMMPVVPATLPQKTISNETTQPTKTTQPRKTPDSDKGKKKDKRRQDKKGRDKRRRTETIEISDDDEEDDMEVDTPPSKKSARPTRSGTKSKTNRASENKRRRSVASGGEASATNRKLKEAIERTILEHTYHDLQRDPNAPTRIAESSAIASHMTDLDIVQIGTFPAHAYLRLNPRSLTFDQTSTSLYKYRGRGPVWSGNSCAVDSVIVLGMLLDIGCTNIDRSSWRYGEITELEKAFIEITNVNWAALDKDTNIKMRDLFSRKLCATVPSFKMGKPAPAWAIWSECTRNIAQFYYKFSTYAKSCPCNNQEYIEKENHANCVLPVIDGNNSNGVWMADLLENNLFKKTESQCIFCHKGTDVSETRIDELPLRMVVSNYKGTRVRINNHTENVSFRYYDSEGKQMVATYRWLGGIYHKDGHVRVYWTDQERGDNSGESIRMYDDEVNGGVIIGGITPQHPTDRVPLDWTDCGFMIGIYERVINPSQNMLAEVMGTVSHFEDLVSQDLPVLNDHTPWENVRPPVPEDPSRANVSHPPEERVIPVATNIFRSLNIHQLPIPLQPTPRVRPKSLPPLSPNQNPDEFDIDSFLETWPLGNPEVEDNPANMQAQQDLFDSMLNSPSRFADFPEMWPDGPPGDNGAFSFPALPRAEEADSLPFSLPQSPMMDFMHWGGSDAGVNDDTMDWLPHVGAARRTGNVKPSNLLLKDGGPSKKKPNKADPAGQARNGKVSVEISGVSRRNPRSTKAPPKKSEKGMAAENKTENKLRSKKSSPKDAGNKVSKKTSKKTGISGKAKETQTRTLRPRKRAAVPVESEKDEASEEDTEDEEEVYTEKTHRVARSSHGGPREPKLFVIPRPLSGEVEIRRTAIRNAMLQSPSKRARFAENLEQGPSKRRKL